MWIRQWWQRLLTPSPARFVALREGRPRLLLVTGEKRNQNYYRDRELARRGSSLWLSEAFPAAAFDYNIGKICAALFPGGRPDWVWVNYQRHFTPRLRGWEALEAPVAAFVGDPQDFVEDSPAKREKVAFFRRLAPQALVTAFPRAGDMVRAGLETDQTPLIPCYWAVPPAIFRPRGRRRPYDIACLGAHTPNVYPFRNRVRSYLENQRRLKFFAPLRVGAHDGPAFARVLNRCRAAFTDASVYGYPLAKFFEIPACGTLLVAEALPDLEPLGFRAGENFVAVTPGDFADRLDYYLREEPEEGAALATAGARLIHTRHTWEIRVTELLHDLSRVLGENWPELVYRPLKE